MERGTRQLPDQLRTEALRQVENDRFAYIIQRKDPRSHQDVLSGPRSQLWIRLVMARITFYSIFPPSRQIQ